jgi:hypothetical protein
MRLFVRKYEATFVVRAENRADADKVTGELVDAMHEALKCGVSGYKAPADCAILGKFDDFPRELVERPDPASGE